MCFSVDECFRAFNSVSRGWLRVPVSSKSRLEEWACASISFERVMVCTHQRSPLAITSKPYADIYLRMEICRRTWAYGTRQPTGHASATAHASGPGMDRGGTAKRTLVSRARGVRACGADVAGPRRGQGTDRPERDLRCRFMPHWQYDTSLEYYCISARGRNCSATATSGGVAVR